VPQRSGTIGERRRGVGIREARWQMPFRCPTMPLYCCRCRLFRCCRASFFSFFADAADAANIFIDISMFRFLPPFIFASPFSPPAFATSMPPAFRRFARRYASRLSSPRTFSPDGFHDIFATLRFIYFSSP